MSRWNHGSVPAPGRPEVAPLPSRDEAIRRWGACVHRADSLEGLRGLVRERPGDWHRILWRCTRPLKAVDDPRLSSLLRARDNSRCMPRHAEAAGTLRPRRAAAARAARVAGRMRQSAVDLPWLEQLENGLAEQGLGHAAVKLTVSLVRRVVVDFRRERGLEGGLRGRSDESSPGARSRERPTPSPQGVARVLVGLTAEERAIIGLIVGCNLRESTVLALRVEDINPTTGLVMAPPGRVPGRRHPVARYGYLPGWAMDLQLAWRPDLGRGQRGLLFPNRVDARRPRTSINPALRRACERAFGPAAPAYRTEDLRRLFQAVARAHGLPSTVVRGTSTRLLDPTTARLVLPREAVEVERLALIWDELCGAATWRIGRVPRRAPKGVQPRDAEPVRSMDREDLPSRARAQVVPAQTERDTEIEPGIRKAVAGGGESREIEPAGLAAALRQPSPRPAVDRRRGTRHPPRITPVAPRPSVRPTTPSARTAEGPRARDLMAPPSPRPDGAQKLADLDRRLRAIEAKGSSPRPPRRVEDIVLSAGLAAVALKSWEHRDSLVDAVQSAVSDVGFDADHVNEPSGWVDPAPPTGWPTGMPVPTFAQGWSDDG